MQQSQFPCMAHRNDSEMNVAIDLCAMRKFCETKWNEKCAMNQEKCCPNVLNKENRKEIQQ